MDNKYTVNNKNSFRETINPKSIDNTPSKIGNNIIEASKTGLINNLIDSNLALRPRLIINDYKKGEKVLSEIISGLEKCSEFMLSVAFITNSGILPLLETLKVLMNKGIKGKILTTDYLNFSEPSALKRLLSFPNITLKMYNKDNFHTKGYIFKYSDHFKVIVGSSNLTQTALTKNKEWNIKISSLEEGGLTMSLLEEFNSMWHDSDNLTIDWLKTYESIYKSQRRSFRDSLVPSISQYKLKPNKMQVSAIESLNKLRKKGARKALLISATGTGKTYLSAFDVRNFHSRKTLFVVHRQQIAKQAFNSYKNVFGDTKTMGILSGTSRDLHSDIIFSTIQTLSKDNTLKSFSKTEFDYILIDEVHKAGAITYQKIVNYFEPKFFLGMTATPERTDDFDIFKLFDHNIAYEIRLQDALKENLLCPFHYFGITDIIVDGKYLNDTSDFKYLVCDDRVNHIVKAIDFYGFSGDKVRGLVFCSSQKEAFELSIKFNNLDFRTTALTGNNSEEEREDAIKRLEMPECNQCLDYIFTVDIFNEGVDIPSVNQVVMLRPTKSSIIFIQQLGRGLRLFNNKEYVVIIDFVGNYNNNFLIPIALSGDKSYNKDNIRRYVLEGNRIIPGCSTVNFDLISKKRIFESIDKTNFNDIKLLKESYRLLKQKLGRIPNLEDFDYYDSIDPLKIFYNKNLGSYHKFLKKYEKEYKVELSKDEELFIEFISTKLACGKRIHELELIKCCIEFKINLIYSLKRILKLNYNIFFKNNTEKSVINVMTNKFQSGSTKKTYSKCIFIEKYNDDYKISHKFSSALKNPQLKNMVLSLVEFGISRYKKYYSTPYMNTNFQLYEKYTYEDVCRLLEWEKCQVPLNIGGYKFDRETKTYPVFINYDKSDSISDSIKYQDRFISSSQIIGISKAGRTSKSEDIIQAYSAEKNGVFMSLFVRKNKDDKMSKEFYFLGKIRTLGNPKDFIMKNTNKTAVEIHYQLLNPVREDIYNYIIS